MQRTNKTCLVTGGAGFIGSHVIDLLLTKGYEVIALDDLSGGYEENINPQAKFILGSITDQSLLEKIFQENEIDHVFHLAAYAAEGLSHFIRHFNYQNNLIGSINLINLSVRYKIKHFIFTSSIAVYGTNQLPLVEDLSPKPEDPYGIAKYAVELDIQAAQKMFGLNYTIFRPHNVYGERQNIMDPYRNVIGIFMRNILNNEPMRIFGDGRQTRSFSHIDDVAPYIVAAIDVYAAKNQCFNIGNSDFYSVNELAQLVAEAMGTCPTIEYLAARNEVIHAYASHEKAQKVFAMQSPVQLKEGIKKMANWVKNVDYMKIKPVSCLEIEEKLPSFWAETFKSMHKS